jgi:hypothetical protein
MLCEASELTGGNPCVQEPDTPKQYPGCPAAGGLLKASGRGQDQGRQQDAEPPRSFIFNELSLEEIKHVESMLVRVPAATFCAACWVQLVLSMASADTMACVSVEGPPRYGKRVVLQWRQSASASAHGYSNP